MQPLGRSYFKHPGPCKESITLPKGMRIKLTGPEPLGLHVQSVDTV